MSDLIKDDTKELDQLLANVSLKAAPYYAEVIQAVAEGSTLKAACDAKGISVGSILGLTVKHPEILEAYTLAKQIKLESKAEELLTLPASIDPTTKHAANEIKKVQLQSNNLMWLLGRLVSNYKEKQQIDVNVSVDLADRLSSGVARVEKEIEGRIVESE